VYHSNPYCQAESGAVIKVKIPQLQGICPIWIRFPESLQLIGAECGWFKVMALKASKVVPRYAEIIPLDVFSRWDIGFPAAGSRKACQQARKTQWQRKKMATDSDYRKNQMESLQNWREHNRDYWRRYAQIEDFLWDQQVSEKTRSDMCSALHAFWAWLVRRDVLEQMPKFPQITFELGWRNIIDLETQHAIIDEVGRTFAHISPKIVLGVRWLSTYVSIRPAEMLGLKEGQIDHRLGCFIIPSPKEKKPKVVPLLDEDLDALKEIPRGLPTPGRPPWRGFSPYLAGR